MPGRSHPLKTRLRAERAFGVLARPSFTPERFLSFVANLSGSAETTQRVNAILADGAAAAITCDSASGIDAANMESAIGLTPGCLPTDRQQLLDIFRSVAIRDAVPGGMERNDLVDVTSLSMTLAYFDVVTMDRKMSSRVREAQLGDLQAATVVGRLEDLEEALRPVAAC